MNDLFAGAPLSAALGLAALALLPLLLMSITSFAKIAVVLSILKNALGASDIPSTAVVTALALALSVFVMAPVTSEVQSRLLASGGASKLSAEAVLAATADPVRAFLAKNAGEREVALFLDMAKQKKIAMVKTDLSVLWPSFAITELKRAFEVGFLVFLPFLVVDLIVASVLLAMGLQGLTPSAVALPFKILLFVSVDGFMLFESRAHSRLRVSPQRQVGIDVARGVAVLAMIQTHAYDGWVLDHERADLSFRITRVLGTLPLPMFLMLAGMGLALRADADEKRERTSAETRSALAKSALKVVFAGYALSFAYAVINRGPQLMSILRPDVLHVIGLCLLALSLVGVGSRARLTGAAVILTLLPVALSPWLTPYGAQAIGFVRPLLGLVVEVPGYAHMPLVPLLSCCATGVGVGLWWARKTSAPDTMTRNLQRLAGLGALLTFLGIAASHWARASGVVISRSHPSIALNVLDLDGRALLALGLCALAAPHLGRALPFLLVCGRHSLFIYGLHLPFCYGRLALPFKHALTMSRATLYVFLLSAFCVACAFAFEHLYATRARK